MLVQDTDLEVSAARVLDLSDPLRIPVLLHADDPLFLASSKGELRRMLRIIAAWSKLYKTCLHVSNSKSVVMVISKPSRKEAFVCNAVLLYQSFAMPAPTPLQLVESHKWLGLTWDFQSTLERHAITIIAAQQSKVAVLACMVQGGSLPLSVALHVFELKVSASLRFGRWLWGLSPRSRERLDAAQSTWAKTLLGAEPWRSSAVALADFGWHMTGSAQCVLDVACRRARLWQAAESNLAGSMFTACHHVNNTWKTRSKRLLLEWGLLDWPIWCASMPAMSVSLEAYASYCKLHLTVLCQSKLLSDPACHTVPVWYSSLPESPSILAQQLPWEALHAVLYLIKFRAGYLKLGHVEGESSQANVQYCIACDGRRGEICATRLGGSFKQMRQSMLSIEHFGNASDLHIGAAGGSLQLAWLPEQNRTEGVSAALKALTLLFVGGASGAVQLLSCQEYDGEGRQIPEDFAFRPLFPSLRCADHDGLAAWVDAVGWSSGVVYAIVVPVFLGVLFAKQSVCTQQTKTVLLVSDDKMPGSWDVA
eukprot:s7062_g1.t1